MLFTDLIAPGQKVEKIKHPNGLTEPWLFHVLRNSFGKTDTFSVQVDESIWLSIADHVTLGRLINPPKTAEETNALIAMLKIRVGSKTMDWWTLGGVDVVKIDKSELHLAVEILEKCKREIYVLNYSQK